MVTKDIFLPVIGQHFIVIEPDGSPGNSALIPPVPYFHNSIPLPPPYKCSGGFVGLVTAIALHLYELKALHELPIPLIWYRYRRIAYLSMNTASGKLGKGALSAN
jgi:hypothetical protein